MSYASMAVQPVQPAPAPTPMNSDALALSALLVAMYAAGKGTKAYRKLKRKLVLTSLKLRAKSFFGQRKLEQKDRTLVYILLGVIALVLIFYAPVAALIIAAIALILLLTGTI